MSNTESNRTHIQIVVEQMINMFQNNVIEGNGVESFEGWCEEGEVFNWDEKDISIMKKLSPYINVLTIKISELSLK